MTTVAKEGTGSWVYLRCDHCGARMHMHVWSYKGLMSGELRLPPSRRPPTVKRCDDCGGWWPITGSAIHRHLAALYPRT